MESDLTAKIVEWDSQRSYGFLLAGKDRVFLHRRDFAERQILGLMKNTLGLLAFLAAVTVAHLTQAQPAEPSLAKLKAAAEAGNAEAQSKLGDAYWSGLDEANALIWYRKAGTQGVAHAQSELGRILMGYATSWAFKPEVRAMHADEAIGWYLKAAQQGDTRAQLGLGRQYEEGKFIKQDYPEAYKWFALAAEGGSPFDIPTIGAKQARDAIILKMSQEEIAEGRKRAAAFRPVQVTKEKMPEPAWVKEIKLQGLSGTVARRLAIINGQTFQNGERKQIKVGGKSVEVHCVEVGESTATIAIEGVTGQRELKLETDGGAASGKSR